MPPSPPFWQAILDEKDRLEEQAKSYQQQLLEAECWLHLLEQDLKDSRAELKQELIRTAFKS